MSLTVVAQLLEKYDIPKDRVGRIEVGLSLQAARVGVMCWDRVKVRVRVC